MRLRCYWLGSIALVACVTSDPVRTAPLERGWVTQVLLGAEAGDTRDAVVRWQAPVHYLVVAAPKPVRQAVDGAFDQLSSALHGAHVLSIEHVNEQDERIGQDGFVTVFAEAPRHAVQLAEQHGAQPPWPGADGWFTIVWNARFELTRAVIFVDPNLADRWLRHTALEEMFQALGPSNDSPLIRDSLLFESTMVAGSHECLARVDKQVLHLLYTELQPGDQAVAIERAMQRAWRFDRAVTATGE